MKLWTSNTCGCSQGKTHLFPHRHHRYLIIYLHLVFFNLLHLYPQNPKKEQPLSPNQVLYNHTANNTVSNKAIVSLANQASPRIFCRCTVFYQFFSIDQLAIKMNYSELCLKERCAVNELEMISIIRLPH